MYRPDVIDLRHFYATLLGKTAALLVRRRLMHWWAEYTPSALLGVGYAPPYLCGLQGGQHGSTGGGQHGGMRAHTRSTRTFTMMPGPQGVVHWPADAPNAAFMADEAEIPLAQQSMDAVVVVHALEFCARPEWMMRELWRIMTPGGRLVVIVPNRRGVWARTDGVPLGHGQPYSSGQLQRLLREAGFAVTRSDTALFLPPLASGFMRRMAGALETVGGACFGAFGGVVMMEAEKQVYAIHPQPVRSPIREALRAKVLVPAGIPSGVPGTVPSRRGYGL